MSYDVGGDGVKARGFGGGADGGGDGSGGGRGADLCVGGDAGRAAVRGRDGELGALLRREGLYSSHLANWRRQRDEGSLARLAPRRRGRPAISAGAAESARLRRENEQLRRQLTAAETVIEIQKKASALLGIPLSTLEDRGSDA